jgi:hypothetical protein
MIREMGDALGAPVSAAATRTMCGGARVVLSVRMAVPEFDGRVEYSGVVDFDSDRCRLEGDSYVADETAPQSTILDGPTTYTLEPDGRWTFTRGAAGTRGMLHPSGLLDALVNAQTSAVQSGERSVQLSLDYDVLNAAADVGLAPEWESTAIAQLSPSRRIAHVTLMRRSLEDPDAGIYVDCAISEPAEVGAIDLPPTEKTISLAAKIEQEHGQPGA